MTVAAVICEYDPFHLGHAALLSRIRARYGAETAVVCLMSGNFVQRAMPAAFDKFRRAEAAARCGADLVLELPLTHAVRSAEGFAQGGVEVLRRLGAADVLCFGSECGDTAALRETAARLLDPAFPPALRAALETGCSFAAARSAALANLGGDADLLRRPNDILAVEYCKALLRLGGGPEPAAFRRPGDFHAAEPDPENPSAAALRARIAAGAPWLPYVPPAAAEALADAPRYAFSWGERAVLARVRTMADEAFARLPGGGEGLWRRFRDACRREPDCEAILRAAKSKRYAHSRLRRMLLCAYLGLTAEDLAREAPYVRALAFTDRGRALLRRLRRSGGMPVVNAGETPPDADYYALERRAADLYALFRQDGPPECGTEERGRVFYAR